MGASQSNLFQVNEIILTSKPKVVLAARPIQGRVVIDASDQKALKYSSVKDWTVGITCSKDCLKFKSYDRRKQIFSMADAKGTAYTLDMTRPENQQRWVVDAAQLELLPFITEPYDLLRDKLRVREVRNLVGGGCALCGSANANRRTCPLNPDAKNQKAAGHPLARKPTNLRKQSNRRKELHGRK